MYSESATRMKSNGNGKRSGISLHDIKSPADLKQCSIDDLKVLADEVREVLIDTCSKNGGHIGANLGVVELTMALHYVFNAPKDKFIFDTSHQSYTHKILTNGVEKFSTICKYPGGLTRFIVRGENPYDVWSAGHACTGLSGAMGFAEAAKHQKTDNQTVCVVGDSALTGGLAYEALNNIGYNQTDMVIILNDNKMGISPNVGAFHEYLKRLSTVAMDDRGRRNIGTIFEKLGFKYYGPIDGHNFEDLVTHLNEMKEIKGPKILHVLTQKGKGVHYMEKDKAKWHEHSAFDIETGDPLKASSQSVEGLAVQTLMQLAEKDPSVVGLTAAMAAGTGMNKFGEKFPARFYDVGIAEEHGVTFSGGLAAEGMKPFVAIYSPFLQRAFDEMMHDVSMMNLPVKFLIPKSAITGDGPTQGGILDISYTRILPHFVVMAPKDEVELQRMVKTAHEYNKGPIAVRYPKGASTVEPVSVDKLETIPIGKAEVVKDGKDVTLLAIGWMVRDAQKAAEELEKKGISAAVINARFAKPLDEKLISEYAKKTGHIITLEENTLMGGFGSAVLECLEKNQLSNVHVKRIGGADDYIPYDKPENIKKKFGMAVEDIVNAAVSMKGKK